MRQEGKRVLRLRLSQSRTKEHHVTVSCDDRQSTFEFVKVTQTKEWNWDEGYGPLARRAIVDILEELMTWN